MTADKAQTEYINDKYRPLSDELAELRRIGENDMIPIILKETEGVLSVVLKLKQPKKILEIGTAIGYSSSFFATLLQEAEIYTIERDEFAYSAAIRNTDLIGVSDRIHLLFGDGQEQVEKLRDKGISGFDFVFIDAGKSHYRRFLESALEICADGALIVSDNIMQRGLVADDSLDPKGKHRTAVRRMRDYLDFITTDRRLDTAIISSGDGLALSLYHKNGRI